MATHLTGLAWRLTFIAVIIIQTEVPSFAQSGASQSAPCRPSVRAAAGMLQPYLDEPWQFIGGGSVRACVTERISVEPEISVSPGSQFDRWTIVPNVLFDLRKPGGTIMPYAIFGAGYGSESDNRFGFRRSYMVWYGGIGVRVSSNGHLFVAPEFRIGDDLGSFLLGIGYHFSRP